MRYVPSFHLLAFLRATTEHQLIGSRGSTPSQPRGRGRGRRRERDIWSGVNPGYSDGEGYLSSQVEDRSTVLQERHIDLTFLLVVFFSSPRVGIFRCIHSFRFCLYILVMDTCHGRMSSWIFRTVHMNLKRVSSKL